MKYDISNKKLDTLKADTNYVYIKDQTLFYPKNILSMVVLIL